MSESSETFTQGEMLTVMRNSFYEGAQYLYNESATDVEYFVEVSDDLTTWHSGPEYTEVITEWHSAGTAFKAVKDRTSSKAAASRWMRMRVVLH